MKTQVKTALLATLVVLPLVSAQEGGLLAGGDIRQRGQQIRVGRPPQQASPYQAPAPAETPAPYKNQKPTPPQPPAQPDPPPTSFNTNVQPLPPLNYVARAHQASLDMARLADTGAIRSIYTGLGQVAGEMAQMRVTNQSSQPVTLNFVPGMVLEAPPDAGAQPLILEEEFSLKLNPGETNERNLICYCLDYNVEPPGRGQAIPYFWSQRVDPNWASSVRVLVAGLELDKNGGYKPLLKPTQHRRVVIQRAIWQDLGQVEGKDALVRDLVKDSNGQITRKTANRVSEGIYSDIEKTLQSAKKLP